MIVARKLIVGLLAGALLTGCSSSGRVRSDIIATSEMSGSVVAGVESVEEQALRAVLDAPTEFVVPFEEDQYAWERAKLFLQRYTKGGVAHEEMRPYGEGELSNSRTSEQVLGTLRPERFVYTIDRKLSTGGFLYTVRCREAGDGAQLFAQRNAKNLARFVQDGNLELSLLVQ